MGLRDEFVQVFEVPPIMQPYVDLVADELEMKLVVALDRRALSADQLAERLDLTAEETRLLLKQALLREIIYKHGLDGVETYTVTGFYLRLDILTSYEGNNWASLPPWVRKGTSEWQLSEWIQLWTPQLRQIIHDPDRYVRMKNRDVLLLQESLELIEAAEFICALPCPCITTLLPGSPVVEGSVRLGERARATLERGQGRRLTTEEAKAHVIALDRAGLVHTGPRGWRDHDPDLEWISHGNCHPSYSFPFRAGLRLGLAKQYPRAHHIAVIDWDKCTHCGLCIGRCPFSALWREQTPYNADGVLARRVRLDEQKCWGCGLCANTCPEVAIEMEGL
jgi:ferredoxin